MALFAQVGDHPLPAVEGPPRVLGVDQAKPQRRPFVDDAARSA
jgi:hypothetical protein